jgi:hypothetical protein
MVLTLLSEQDPPAAVTVVRTAVGKGADVTSAPAFPAVKSSYAVMLTDTPAVSSADEEVTVYTAVYLLHWSAPLLQELSCWILSVAGQVTPAVHLVNAAVAMLTDGMRISSDTSMLSVIMVFTLAHLGSVIVTPPRTKLLSVLIVAVNTGGFLSDCITYALSDVASATDAVLGFPARSVKRSAATATLIASGPSSVTAWPSHISVYAAPVVLPEVSEPAKTGLLQFVVVIIDCVNWPPEPSNAAAKPPAPASLTRSVRVKVKVTVAAFA